MLCPACKHTLEHTHCVRCGQPWEAVKPDPEASIAALLVPFAHDPRSNSWPEDRESWRARQRICAELSQIMDAAENARHCLNWFYLNKDSNEKAAIPHLRKLREKILALIP